MAFDPITAGLDFAGKLLDKLFPDPVQRAAAQIQLLQLQQSGELAQIAVNQEEAKNENLFVSGWRPAVGWTCAAAFAYHLILQPLISFIASGMGYTITLPVFDNALLSDTLFGMLGIGSLRTVEKLGDKGNLPWQQ